MSLKVKLKHYQAPGSPHVRVAVFVGRNEGALAHTGENAIRVTIEEAATLQSFPDDYPWQEAGTRTAAFQCIGNAVPPLMARGVLEAVL